ncbi:MAG: hypothetical protein U9N42_05730, partial [Campylobacterota bacterium]|nr:hypothetical protein [Campylobacterota bacterium]
NVLAHELQSDGSYVKVKPTGDDILINSQELIEKHMEKISKATKKETATKVQSLAARLFKDS